MKIGYFDCIGGAGGDMILGSLIDAGLAADSLKKELTALPLGDWSMDVSRVKKGGITATLVNIRTPRQNRTRNLKDILEILNKSLLPKTDIGRAAKIFQRLAESEAKIHGKKINQVYFHEIGGVDSIIDIAGVVCGLRLMNIDKVIVSPLPIGRGIIHSFHGPLPLPAPATVELLKNFSVYGVEEDGETVTPTAAAILSTLASPERLIPTAKIKSVGYGAGTAEFNSRPNLLRFMICEVEISDDKMELLILLETNIDDVNPQIYDFVNQRLFKDGALDVWLTPIQMKKNRPAVTLSILCQLSEEHAMMEILFREGLTLGIRRQIIERRSLTREIRTVNTKFGKIRVKVASYGQRIVRAAPEYDDCKKIAEEKVVPVGEVILSAMRCF